VDVLANAELRAVMMSCRHGLVAMVPVLVSALVLAVAPPNLLSSQERAPAPHLPSRAEAAAVCNMVAVRGPAIEPMLVKDGALDANNDGIADDVTVEMRGGTMRGEDLAFRPRGAAKDSKPADVTQKDFEPGRDYFPFGARWLPYNGKVYTLYFDAEDLRYPSYLGFIDAADTEHLVCDFDHSERETLSPVRDADAGVCRAVGQGDVSYVKVADAPEADADVASRRWSSRVTGHVMVDFDNTGTSTALTLVEFASGAGRGCDLNYFDVILGGKLARAGNAHAILMKLQDIELSEQGAVDFTQGRCDGSTPRWFARDGLIYVDIAGGPDVRGTEPFHEVRLAHGTRLDTVCKGSFAVSWKVKSIGPEFR
jgi:hypothetical protein